MEYRIKVKGTDHTDSKIIDKVWDENELYEGQVRTRNSKEYSKIWSFCRVR